MSECSTVDLGVRDYSREGAATGDWTENLGEKPDNLPSIVRTSGLKSMLFAILAAPATAVNDWWYQECLHPDVVTVERLFEQAVGRSISRIEALSIVRSILIDAEEERLKLVQVEASQGVHWGDEE